MELIIIILTILVICFLVFLNIQKSNKIKKQSIEIKRLKEIEKQWIRWTDRDAKGRFVKNE